jgi:CheY-like chemotaxis protein
MNQDNSTPVKGDILVVDDDMLSLQTLSRMLEQQGYEVRRA